MHVHKKYIYPYIIPYPSREDKEKKYKALPTLPNFNLTKEILDDNFTYIPVPEEDRDQDIVIR